MPHSISKKMKTSIALLSLSVLLQAASAAPVTQTTSQACPRTLCKGILTGRFNRDYWDRFEYGHVCFCAEAEGQSFTCKKQLDAGYSAENRGPNKTIHDNTWVCDIPQSEAFGGDKEQEEESDNSVEIRPIESDGKGSDKFKATQIEPCQKQLCDLVFNVESRDAFEDKYAFGDRCSCAENEDSEHSSVFCVKTKKIERGAAADSWVCRKKMSSIHLTTSRPTKLEGYLKHSITVKSETAESGYLDVVSE